MCVRGGCLRVPVKSTLIVAFSMLETGCVVDSERASVRVCGCVRELNVNPDLCGSALALSDCLCGIRNVLALHVL